MLPPATLPASSAFQRFAVAETLKKGTFLCFFSFFIRYVTKKRGRSGKFWLTGKNMYPFRRIATQIFIEKSAPDLRLGLLCCILLLAI
jgi:hypothetical protein